MKLIKFQIFFTKSSVLFRLPIYAPGVNFHILGDTQLHDSVSK